MSIKIQKSERSAAKQYLLYSDDMKKPVGVTQQRLFCNKCKTWYTGIQRRNRDQTEGNVCFKCMGDILSNKIGSFQTDRYRKAYIRPKVISILIFIMDKIR